MLVRFTLALAAAALFAGGACAQVRSVDLQGPRPFGYLIGDIITLDVDIAVAEPFTLIPGSLPQARSVRFWLDLKSVTAADLGTQHGEHRYRVAVNYQTFYAPLEPLPLEIPGFTLSFGDGTNHAEAAVPSWTFLMSPLREIRPTQGEGATLVRPDVEPVPVPVAMLRNLTIGSGAITLLLLGLLAYHRAWWPFSRRRARPFVWATRGVRRALAADTQTRGYLAGLVVLHRAFDTTAGRRLLADDVPDFISRLPAFRPLEPDIDRFFQASQHAFFGADPTTAMVILAPDMLIVFGNRLAAAERAAP